MQNSVSTILKTKTSSTFKNLTFEQKSALKELGPPRPDLTINQEQKACKGKNSFRRKFNRSLYDYADWLCGCETKNIFNSLLSCA